MSETVEGIVESSAVTVVEANAIESIERATVDMQISTAHKYPRSLERFNRTALAMVTQDEATAESCIYSRPVGQNKDGSQKYAEGMSIRMAEIVGASYGNIRVGSMIIEQTPRQVKARGFAHDLESNFAATSEHIESTVDKFGKPYSERQRAVNAKSALSKALRDATFKVIPRALCKGLEDAARKTAIGNAATLEKRRTAVMEWISKLSIPAERVFAALKITGVADIGLNELETLTGLKTAIKEGDTSVDEAFPPIASADTGKDTGKSRAEKLAGKLKDKATAPTTPPTPPDEPKKEAPAATSEQPFDRTVAVAEIKALVDKTKASKCDQLFKMAGLSFSGDADGKSWEMEATDAQLQELVRLFKA